MLALLYDVRMVQWSYGDYRRDLPDHILRNSSFIAFHLNFLECILTFCRQMRDQVYSAISKQINKEKMLKTLTSGYVLMMCTFRWMYCRISPKKYCSNYQLKFIITFYSILIKLKITLRINVHLIFISLRF